MRMEASGASEHDADGLQSPARSDRAVGAQGLQRAVECAEPARRAAASQDQITVALGNGDTVRTDSIFKKREEPEI